jgi:hypothetical protein
VTTFWISIVAIVAWTAQAAPAVTPAHRCDWTPPAADREVRVRNVQELQRAVSRLEPSTI